MRSQKMTAPNNNKMKKLSQNQNKIFFHKMHGLANDFVIVDLRSNNFEQSSNNIIHLCDRKTGIGCDQLILVDDHDTADISMKIYNPDGSQASACGNATRCVAKMLNNNYSTIAVGDKILSALKISSDIFSVDMGEPEILKEEINLNLNTFRIVDVGNLHIVIFDKIEESMREKIAIDLQNNSAFPDGINVNFATVIDAKTVSLQTWERGVGFTKACGTGACATQVAAFKLGLTQPVSDIIQDGGKLKIDFTSKNVKMVGSATYVFKGEIILQDN